MTVQILLGDCRDMLLTLADKSVHCCVTSPPLPGASARGRDGRFVKGARAALKYESDDEHHRTKAGLRASERKFKPRKADLATTINAGAYAEGKSERMGRGAGWRNNGVGFGHGYDGDRATERGRIKSNESFHASMYEMPPMRNKRSVWTLATEGFDGAHFATFPTGLVEPCILAGCPEGGTVLDPFGGSGTAGMVADRHGRHAILIDLDERNLPMACKRVEQDKWNARKRTPRLFTDGEGEAA
jgi:DNA modification methylase